MLSFIHANDDMSSKYVITYMCITTITNFDRKKRYVFGYNATCNVENFLEHICFDKVNIAQKNNCTNNYMLLHTECSYQQVANRRGSSSNKTVDMYFLFQVVQKIVYKIQGVSRQISIRCLWRNVYYIIQQK